MNSDGILKHLARAFVMAFALYAAFFSCDQHLRLRKGPWQITFTGETNGHPVIIVNQPKLNIANVKIVFTGQTLAPAPRTVLFDTPIRPAPFGKILFFDTTYLPGTVTFDLFGHEIELLPRTLVIDKKESPWQSNSTLSLPVQLRAAPRPEEAK